jgi:putative MFS transporter
VFGFVRSAPELEAREWSLLGLLGLTLLINHYDFAVLTLALPQIQAGLWIPEQEIGRVVASIRLGVLPALLLAFVADRAGRRRMLVLTILGFTLCTTLTAFAPNASAFVALQFTARMFIAAEEMLAIVVIAEEFTAEARGFGLGILAAFGALGFGAAALVLALVNKLPFGWRALYLVGALPLLWVAWLRRRIPETRRFEAERGARPVESSVQQALRPLRELASRYPGRMLALCAALTTAAIATTTAATFVSKFLQQTHGYAPGQVTLLFVSAGFLVFVSTVAAGTLADRFGRRRMIAAALGLNALGIFGFYHAQGPWVIASWVLMAGCSVGADVLFGALGSELFPTSYRSTASGVRSAAATVGGSLGLWLEAQLFPTAGSHAAAITWLLGLAWLAPVIVLASLPETARRELEDIAPSMADATRP